MEQILSPIRHTLVRGKRLFLLLLFIAAGLLAATYFWLFAGLPDAEIDPARLQSSSMRITDRNGRLLYESLPETGGRHIDLAINQIPLALRQATIATEDANFYQNPGVDLGGVARAVWINLTGGETISGGSTITQQVARNLLMSAEERAERSLRRKAREAVLAWQLTQRYSKDEILALYLNQSYYGSLSYGVEAAAQTYFGKPVTELDLAECALLAGLPQAPAAYDPFAEPQAAMQRRATVLGLMEKAGFINAEQRALAEREPLVLAAAAYPMNAPHFSLWVRAQVESLVAQGQIPGGVGLVVRTTLDLDAQQAAEEAVHQQLERLRQKGQDGLSHNVNNAALVALDPHSGEILAMVGSPDMNDSQHSGAVNMALSPRQPGSALKPLIYAAAFDPSRSQPWTASTMILDVSTHFITHDNQPYTPKNYDGQEHGPVLAREALASSLNIPAVLTLKEVGLPAFFDFARQFGLDSFGDPDKYDLSLALGGGEVRLIDLTAAYGSFANGGKRVNPAAILDIQDGQGQILFSPTAQPAQRILDERVAWLISDILSDDDARLLGFQAHSALNIDRPAAVKTGTTTNFHDNWAVGYTPDLVVGVWVGNANHEAMREVNGLTGAAPIWHQAMRAMLSGQAERPFVQPDGLTQTDICALSGLQPSPACTYRRMEWFIDGTQPAKSDTFYQTIVIDSDTGQLAGPQTPPHRRKAITALDLPPAAHAWARTHGLPLLADFAAARSASRESQPDAMQGAAAEEGISILTPAAMTIYRSNSGLPPSAQRIPIEAYGPAILENVTIWLDGSPLETFTQPPYRVFWVILPGDHIVWVEADTPDGKHLTSERVPFQVDPELPEE